MTTSRRLSLLMLAFAAASPCPSQAIHWTNWFAASVGTPGSAAGTVSGVPVSYAGEVLGAQTAGGTFYWLPASTFGGSSAPTTTDVIRLLGNYTGNNVITFASPVRDPVIAILSLGSSTTPVDYVFDHPFSILAGGPSNAWGGTSITNPAGNTARGREGNGVIRFSGTLTSIRWTVSRPESWHGFTVGIAGTASLTASYTTVGGSCVGLAGTPNLAAQNTPIIGTTSAQDVTGLSPYALPFVLTGFSSTASSGGGAAHTAHAAGTTHLRSAGQPRCGGAPAEQLRHGELESRGTADRAVDRSAVLQPVRRAGPAGQHVGRQHLGPRRRRGRQPVDQAAPHWRPAGSLLSDRQRRHDRLIGLAPFAMPASWPRHRAGRRIGRRRNDTLVAENLMGSPPRRPPTSEVWRVS